MPDEDEFEVSGPLGTKAKARGPSAMLALLLVTGFGSVIGLVYAHHKEMKEDSSRVETAVSEMVYVMSLSDVDRAKLRIAMPDSLRQKIRRGRDGE